jgi:hypothetical protein
LLGVYFSWFAELPPAPRPTGKPRSRKTLTLTLLMIASFYSKIEEEMYLIGAIELSDAIYFFFAFSFGRDPDAWPREKSPPAPRASPLGAGTIDPKLKEEDGSLLVGVGGAEEAPKENGAEIDPLKENAGADEAVAETEEVTEGTGSPAAGAPKLKTGAEEEAVVEGSAPKEKVDDAEDG